MASTLAWPVRIEGGDFAVVEVGSLDEAAQNVAVLSQTRPGERVGMLAQAGEYGVPDPVGLPGYDPQPLIDQARRWVPGVTVNADRLPADRRDFTSAVEVSR